MKISTLKSYFKHTTKRTKLFIIGGEFPNEFLLTGFCYDPQEEGEDLVVNVGPYVVYSFERDHPLCSEMPFLGVRLIPGSKLTRRIHTHRRNVMAHRDLRTLQPVEEYFDLAWSLET